MKYRKLYILLVVMAMSLSAYAFPTSTYADHSALSSGKWVKIAVEKSGIYRITASDISKWGFSKISAIRIYGYGGKPISEDTARKRHQHCCRQTQPRDKGSAGRKKSGP